MKVMQLHSATCGILLPSSRWWISLLNSAINHDWNFNCCTAQNISCCNGVRNCAGRTRCTVEETLGRCHPRSQWCREMSAHHIISSLYIPSRSSIDGWKPSGGTMSIYDDPTYRYITVFTDSVHQRPDWIQGNLLYPLHFFAWTFLSMLK